MGLEAQVIDRSETFSAHFPDSYDLLSVYYTPNNICGVNDELVLVKMLIRTLFLKVTAVCLTASPHIPET